MRVKAKEVTGQKYAGYYNHKRRLPGEVFTLIPVTRVNEKGQKITIAPEIQFSKKWMERVDDAAPKAAPKEQQPVSDIVQGDEVI